MLNLPRVLDSPSSRSHPTPPTCLQHAPLGFWDPTEDGEVKAQPFTKKRRTDVLGVPSAIKEQQQEREDKKRLDELKKKDLPAAIMQVNKVKLDQDKRPRSKLVLPAPQVSDKELEELVKLGQSGASLPENDGDAATSVLLQDYNQVRVLEAVASMSRGDATDTSFLPADPSQCLRTHAEAPCAEGHNSSGGPEHHCAESDSVGSAGMDFSFRNVCRFSLPPSLPLEMR